MIWRIHVAGWRAGLLHFVENSLFLASGHAWFVGCLLLVCLLACLLDLRLACRLGSRQAGQLLGPIDGTDGFSEVSCFDGLEYFETVAGNFFEEHGDRVH